MRKYRVFCLMAAFVGLVAISAQAAGGGKLADSLTSDDTLDPTVHAINEGLKAGTAEFGKKLGQYYNMPESVVNVLLHEMGLAPADAYMAARVSSASGRNVEEVADAFHKNKEKGWGAIAKEMGIKPGSEAFHALKSDDSGLLREFGIEISVNQQKKGNGKGQNGKGESKGKGKKGNK